ncbi:MAG: tRNA uridine-5-carboxymethylaminomethyl(34) synthesis enzyme MnmG [Bacilli bacterium]|nr:tRNA uridine-5-carboxymethylaminomethyl(34) synthesis enzyme MnmG [Bacilli bacterium]
MNVEYDVIVIGGGHAGVEASHAPALMGLKVLLCTLNEKMIGNMPCNPHIGGSAKGVVVREIDALGGLMGLAADHHPLQVKMLNTGKGPGVQCLRTQQDKYGYPAYVQTLLKATPNLDIKECEVVDFIMDGDTVKGVITSTGERIASKAVIVTTGTYLNGRIISGRDVHDGGPDGEKASLGLTKSLNKIGVKTWRLKTGTPPRLDKASIDFSKAEIEPGTDAKYAFSFRTKEYTPLEKQLPCYLIYTTAETHKIITDNLPNSALFNGVINSAGPRYCPSIESKVVRFADKERHQLFLEPETENGNSIYLQGFSTAMPHEVQVEMVHSLPGLENAVLLKYAYQIEYDAIEPLQFDNTLAVKSKKGLYGAGQICGTSGYEEAAGLGLMAGINAALFVKGKKPFVLKRNESYIGVMIDDLVTKGTDEPYRLLSSRAEYRLLLRHDNADLRLTKYGHDLGLISDEDFAAFEAKYQRIEEVIRVLSTTNVGDKVGLNALFEKKGSPTTNEGLKGYEVLKRPHYSYKEIAPLMRELDPLPLDDESILALEARVKYEGYIKKEEREASEILRQEDMELPTPTDYLKVEGLRLEARQKLNVVQPKTIAQASRIPGVNPADISILILTMKRDGKL